MSQFRVYFYNAVTRQEMTDYEGNGKTWMSLGGNALNAKGQFVRGTATEVGFANYASLSKVSGEKRVTAADFDHPVAVKVWYGPSREDNESVEWRKLVASNAFATSDAVHVFKPGSRDAKAAEAEYAPKKALRKR
jgi:hypothetical protein